LLFLLHVHRRGCHFGSMVALVFTHTLK
jgi:hypothetical protein